MEKDNVSRYFIGIVPPEPLRTEIDLMKRYMADHFNSTAALRSPPHLTLHMPFNWKSKKEDKLTEALADFAAKEQSFGIHLENFGCFDPRVIFIGVGNNPALHGLYGRLRLLCRRELQLLNAEYKNLPFHPHITIAFRDLRKDSFRIAWEEFRERKFSTEFLADSIVLLRHTGTAWKECNRFTFGIH